MTRATFDTIQWESPLVDAIEAHSGNASREQAGVRLAEQAFSTHINLRGGSNNAAFTEAVQRVTGVSLPTQPNTYHHQNNIVITWLGPDEWLITAAREQANPLQAELKTALSDQFAAITDVSHGFTAIRVSGEQARLVLGKGTSLDLSPDCFAAGQCAQSGFAKSSAIFWAESDTELGLIVRRSFAEYIWKWLINAGRDVGVFVDKSS